MKIKHSLSQPNSPLRTRKSRDFPINNPTVAVVPPIKYLLHNNLNLTIGSEPNRKSQQIDIIARLLHQCSIFRDIDLDISSIQTIQSICNGVVLIYCESPHIMQVKDNQIYIFFEGQGFEYMQNHLQDQNRSKYKIYENNQYIMLRKINTNEYFLSLQDYNVRYHSPQKKYQLMVDENTLIGKISQELFIKLFQPKILERQKNIITFLKRVDIFKGLPNPFFIEFTKFISELRQNANDKIISREEKSKYMYLIREGEVELRYYNDKNGKTTPYINQNYVFTSGKLYNTQKLGPFLTFGMDLIDDLNNNAQKEVVCLTDCSFYVIDKRLLAIIITSFELQFQQKQKLFAAVNINSQIKGQSYCSPEQQALLQNAERIKTSERKIRDIKLRYLSSNKAKKQTERVATPIQITPRKTEQMLAQSKQLNSTERMNKTAQGRFRTVSEAKFINNFAILDQAKHNILNKKLEGNTAKLSQIQIMALEEDMGTASPILRYSNAFEYRDKMENTKFIKTHSLRSDRNDSGNKFVPRVQSKPVHVISPQKYKKDMIGVFLDRKIKNEIVRKVQRVKGLNQNEKIMQNRNLKRLFAGKQSRTITAMSELDKRTIAQDIIERMSDLKSNPLLLQIEGERRKMQRQMKLMDRKPKTTDSSNRKYKKEDELILIKNNED